jgi:gluconate 2-dehydrogenase gamma chain
MTTASAMLSVAVTGRAAVVKGVMPITPGDAYAPVSGTGPWHYFTESEGAAIEALVDRLIPADADTPGGKDMGCAIYIDRQLAGPFGRSEGFYMSGPFQSGTKQQGPQTAMTPAKTYRQALADLDKYCRGQFSMPFVQLKDAQKDQVIHGLEGDTIKLEASGAKDFFQQLLANTQEGFFADPIYGGNKDMAAWTMIGFPGARYDYRDWVSKHNQPFPLPPIGMADHPGWWK